MEEQIQSNENPTTQNVTLSNIAINSLSRSAPWMKFLSIMGFILCGVMILTALIMMVYIFTPKGSYGVGWKSIAFIFYFILAVIIYFPNYYLYSYAGSIRKFIQTKDEAALEAGFQMQKKYWVFMGGLVITYLSIIVIVILFTIGSGLAKL